MDIWERSRELDNKEEYELSNALVSLGYLMDTYEEVNTLDKSFGEWYEMTAEQISDGTCPFNESSEVICWFNDVALAMSEMATDDVNALDEYIENAEVKTPNTSRIKFERLAVQEFIDHEIGARYLLEWNEGNDEMEDFYTIKMFDENGEVEDEDCFLGTTPDNNNNVAMMAWEYNAVPVK